MSFLFQLVPNMPSAKPFSHQMLTSKHFPRPSSSRLLMDYLRDDLSSCSSSGFKSFPRRQCCSSTAHLLLDKDLKSTNTKRIPTVLGSSSSRTSASTTISAYLQKASEAVINVAKLLPFPSISSSPPLPQKIHKTKKGNILSRSLSRKLLSKSFWRRALKEEGNETRRWKWFREEQDKPTELVQNTTAVQSGATMGLRASSSTSGSSDSWAESEFTLQSTSSNYESCAENDVVESKNVFTVKTMKKTTRVGSMVGEEFIDGVTTSTTTTKLDWTNVGEKQQFSPVSVLSCPFEDDDSSLDSECFQLEGTKQQKMRKSRRLACLEPVDLEKRIALSELDSPMKPPYSVPSTTDNEDEIEEKARDLLNQVQRSSPWNCLMDKAENLLFDFFKQNTQENPDRAAELLKAAKEWINGEAQQMCLGWELKEGRQSYLKEMDKCCGSWRTQYSGHQEKQELALHLEFEIFTYLLNDLIVDITL